MTRSCSRSASHARSALPRRSPPVSLAQPGPPHSDYHGGGDYDSEDYNNDESSAEDRELTRSEKLRHYIADSPSPTGSPMQQDDSLLNAQELHAKIQEVKHKACDEYVYRTEIQGMLREEHERAESLDDQASRLKNHAALLEARVARLKDELASTRAEEARRDVDIVALQRQLAPAGANCRNYHHPRVTCDILNCGRIHIDDDKSEDRREGRDDGDEVVWRV